MQYMAIRHRKTGRLVSGTDFNYSPPRQMYATENRPPLLLSFDPGFHQSELVRRNIKGRNYELVCVELVEKDREAGAKLDTPIREGFSDA